MTDAGFFRGTSAEQDNRFSDKHKKLLKQMKFNDVILQKVDLKNVNLAVLRPWINRRVTEVMGQEDEVLAEFIYNQLEESKSPDARMMQINITGFMNSKNAREFMAELWELLLSAMQSPNGIPPKLIEEKKQELVKKQEAEEQARSYMKLQLAREEAERLRLKQQLQRLEQDTKVLTNDHQEGRKSRSKSPKDNGGRDKLKNETKRSEVTRLNSPEGARNYTGVRRGRSPGFRRRDSPVVRTRSPKRYRSSPSRRSRSPRQRRRSSPARRSRSPRKPRSRSPRKVVRSPKRRSHSRSPGRTLSKHRKQHHGLKKSHRRSSSLDDHRGHRSSKRSSHRSPKPRSEKRSHKSSKTDRRAKSSSSSSSPSSSKSD